MFSFFTHSVFWVMTSQISTQIIRTDQTTNNLITSRQDILDFKYVGCWLSVIVMFKSCSYGSNVGKPKLIIFWFRHWREVCSVIAAILLSVHVRQSHGGEEEGEDQFEEQDEDEDDRVGAVLHHDVSVDDGVRQDLLLVSGDWVEDLRVKADGGRDVKTDHESLRVFLVTVGADVVIEEVLSQV